MDEYLVFCQQKHADALTACAKLEPIYNAATDQEQRAMADILDRAQTARGHWAKLIASMS